MEGSLTRVQWKMDKNSTTYTFSVQERKVVLMASLKSLNLD